jgi:hypothetical protein
MTDSVAEALAAVLRAGPHSSAQRQITVEGVSVGLARFADEIAAVVKGSFAPVFILGRSEYPFSDAVASISGLSLCAADRWPSFRPERWLDDSGNQARLEALSLVTGESLTVGSNVIDLRGFPGAIDLWLVRLENLAALAIALAAPEQPDPGIDHLTAQGVDRSFVERWAVSDDVDRAELIASASDAELAEMLVQMERIWPRLAPFVQGAERNAPGADTARELVEAAEEIELELARRPGGP